MNVLVIGSGGREHVLAWKIKQSSLVSKLYCLPGNGGTAGLAENVDISADDNDAIINFAQAKKIDLVVIGPEAPLVAGLADALQARRIKVFGPSQQAAKLEGSKAFSKEFMKENHIPTASFQVFENFEEASEYVSHSDFPLVVKADGLASGKGVFICKDEDQAQEALKQIMKTKVFKEAGNKVIIEECLEGDEASILAISDGKNYVMLESSQDHKRIFDDDLGPNTGGMGAYSPAPIIDEEMKKTISSRVIEPTIRGMNRRGTPFKGVLYAGLMITKDGPMVLEYNVRLGDPETQAVLPRLKTDLMTLILAVTDETLNEISLEWDSRPCVCVVMSSGGYPGKYESGKEIKGLDVVNGQMDALVFHAGTKKENDKIVTSGGRVLGVTCLGESLPDAIKKTYHAVEKISFDRVFFRRDIGAKAYLNIRRREVTSPQ